jgi:HEAT repeat protein
MTDANPTFDPPSPDIGADGSSDAIDALCRIVAEGVDVHRCIAARALGRIGAEDAASTLIQALLDEDEDVRADAATALARFGIPAAGDQLLENLLGDPSGAVKLAAIDALIAMRHPGVLPWLLRLAERRDEEVVWDEDEFATGDWDDWADIQARAIDGLAEFGDERGVRAILGALTDEFGQDISEAAFKALARLGTPGISALVPFLKAKSARPRRRVAAALSTAPGGPSDEIVARVFNDPEPEVRLAMAEGLAAGDPLDPRLKPLLDDEDAEVRAWAARRAGSFDAEAGLALLSDPSALVRAASLTALTDANLASDSEVVDRVTELLDDPVEAVVVAAVTALSSTGLPLAQERLAELAVDAEQPEAVRVAAIDSLSGLGDTGAIEPLLAAMIDEGRAVRLQAMTSLAKLATQDSELGEQALEALLAAARGELVEPAPTPEPELPAAIEETDGSESDSTDEEELLEEPAPTSTLAAILAEGSPKVVAIAERTKGVELSPKDIERLARAQATPKKKRVSIISDVALADDLRRVGARLLGDMARPNVAEALAALLGEDDAELRRTAADSLARIAGTLGGFGEAVSEALRTAVSDSDSALRLAVVRALGHSGDPDMARRLHPRLRDEDVFVRKEAVLSLGRLGRVDRLANMLTDENAMVRMAAARALFENQGEAAEYLLELVPAHEGVHAREIGRLFRQGDRTAANRWLVALLTDEARRDVWASAIDALEELYRTDLKIDDAQIENPAEIPVAADERRVA